MPLDPKARELIASAVAQNQPGAHQVSPGEARRMSRERRVRLDTAPEAVGRIEDRRIPGPGGELALRIYTPLGEGPFPALVYFHGGGWLTGDLDNQQSSCCVLANSTPCLVVSVAYRLAPENKFPAAAEDCYAATCWVAGNASSIQADRVRIAVGGDSAGGNLAAAVSLMARDRRGPALAFQVLIYPVIDCRFDTPSYQENGAGYLLTKEMCVYFWRQYLPEVGDGVHPYAAPIRAESLAGLPPALVITAQYDPLRDDGQGYARRLQAAGVPVTVRNYEGLIHGFWGMGAVFDQTFQARREVAEALRAALAGQVSAAS